MILFIYFVILHITIVLFLSKAGTNIFEALIPIYNLYLFIKALKLSPILLFLLSLGLIFLKDRMLIFTLIYVFLPFICAYTFSCKKIWAILALALPVPFYFFLPFCGGYYIYDERWKT